MNSIVKMLIHLELPLSNMLDLNDLYQQRVATCAENFKKVYLNPVELRQLELLAAKIVPVKSMEASHRKDGTSELKRFTNGLKGELAVSKYLKMNIVNMDVGTSGEFDVPDIPGYNVGIKTVEYGHFPIIPKVNTYPQIICICHPTANGVVYICGLADVETLTKYQHDDLILDPNLKMKGTKTGFWGFSQLKEVTLEALEPYKVEADSEPLTEENSTIVPLTTEEKTE